MPVVSALDSSQMLYTSWENVPWKGPAASFRLIGIVIVIVGDCEIQGC